MGWSGTAVCLPACQWGIFPRLAYEVFQEKEENWKVRRLPHQAGGWMTAMQRFNKRHDLTPAGRVVWWSSVVGLCSYLSVGHDEVLPERGGHREGPHVAHRTGEALQGG